MRIPLTIWLALPAVCLWFWPGANELLQFERAAVAGGDGWRLLSAHWTHWSFDHLLWDLAVFLGLGLICERNHPRAFRLTLAMAIPAIGMLVWWGLPHLTTYRGLSGLDSALYMLLCMQLLRGNRPFLRGLALWAALGFVAKCLFEIFQGQTLFADTQQLFVPVPTAHLVGALVGAWIGFRTPLPEPTEQANNKTVVSRLQDTPCP